ncbi:MAG: hypothetical protein BWY56_00308 [Acidobacteria bacterium ADurb.Bin340]|nr:MAG: hypothetical protein BWY56_00308 [Acidobacteria bacterium ADurb.Bin340]
MESHLPNFVQWRREMAEKAAKDRAASDRILEGEYKNEDALKRARKKVKDLELYAE